MATIFGFCPETAEGFYGTWANPASVLNTSGFIENGQATAHGFTVFSRPAGNIADANTLGVLDRSINRILPGQDKKGWTAADAQAWAQAHPGVVAYAVFQV